jgi:protein-L-isoaspartate(D-aspartate) O-methyltransferase
VPQLENGDFEITTARDVLLGWYYRRNATLVSGNEAFGGQRSLKCTAQTSHHSAHILQAFGVNGEEYHTLKMSLMVRTENISKPPKNSFAGFKIHFYNDKRQQVGEDIRGPWHGTQDWTRKEATIEVPAKAKLAVIFVGCYGVTGDMYFDDIVIQPTQK